MWWCVRVIEGLFLGIANWFVAAWMFALMTFPSDLTFVAGLVGLVVLFCIDGLIVVHALKKYGFWGEDL
jgi:hypothetical protein